MLKKIANAIFIISLFTLFGCNQLNQNDEANNLIGYYFNCSMGNTDPEH